MFSSNSKDRESVTKEVNTIAEYIKYMPNLLDFDNKRMYFKK